VTRTGPLKVKRARHLPPKKVYMEPTEEDVWAARCHYYLVGLRDGAMLAKVGLVSVGTRLEELAL
jgi:hypothetical protein